MRKIYAASWIWFIYFLFFTLLAFLDARLARGCVRTGLKSHARCHPCPIPQPVKVDDTTGIYDPYSFRMVMWVLLRPTRINQWKCCETEPTVFRPYPRRLESLIIWRSCYKGSTFFSVTSRPWVLVRQGFEPATSRSADRRSPNWANQATVYFDNWSWQSFVTTCDVFNGLFPPDVQNEIQLL